MEKGFQWRTWRRNFSTSCLPENSSSFLGIGTKFKPLLRTDFSELESGIIFMHLLSLIRFDNLNTGLLFQIKKSNLSINEVKNLGYDQMIDI